MIISKAKSATIISATLIVVSLHVLIFEISFSANKAFVAALPHGLRTVYLNRIFSTTSADCRGCRLRLIAALELLEDDVGNGQAANYDYARILPFIRSDSHSGYDEPVSEMACNDVLGGGNRAVMVKMVLMYRAEPQIIKECVVGRLDVVKHMWPNRYEAIAATVRQVPAMAIMLRQAGI
jgi:hypothetical protein